MKNLHMDNDSFGLEIASESENVKEKSEDEVEETVFDVKEKRKPEKTGDFIMPDKPDIKIMMKMYFESYLYGNGMKLCRLYINDTDSDEDDMLPDLV